MSAVGITENAKGDNKKFEIWCNSRDEVFIVQVTNSAWRSSSTAELIDLVLIIDFYLLQAPTPEIKSAWVNEIRKVLTEQLKACRGTKNTPPRPLSVYV